MEEAARRGPKPTTIDLTDIERAGLEALVRRRSMSQHIATRARIILAAADGGNNGQIARALRIGLDQARHWRGRWLSLDGLAEDLSLSERERIAALIENYSRSWGETFRESLDELLRLVKR